MPKSNIDWTKGGKVEMRESWDRYLKILRKRWGEIPLADQRLKSIELEKMSDEKLLRLWQSGRRDQTEGEEGFSLRGWYHALYKPIFRRKKLLDVGSGAGVDGISFAQGGAQVTFLDIVDSNVRLARRLCDILGVKNADFLYLRDARSLEALDEDYDVIWCQGSQITAPFDIVQEEDRALIRHLKPNGRWIELGYPKTRWEREGRRPFESWGEATDGGAPWIEWYDLDKILRRLEPARFRPILYFEFHSSDFNWFDLLREDEN